MQSVSTQKNLMPIKFTGKLTNDEIQQGFSRPVWQWVCVPGKQVTDSWQRCFICNALPLRLQSVEDVASCPILISGISKQK